MSNYDVARLLTESGYRLDEGGSFEGLSPCPYAHPDDYGHEYEYRLVMAHEGFLNGDRSFFVLCGCDARGPLADDPVEAVRMYEGRR